MDDVVIVGAGGHGKVIADIVVKSGQNLRGFLDDNRSLSDNVLGFPILGAVSDIPLWAERGCRFLLAIGNNEVRRRLAEQYRVAYATAVHPTACLGLEVQLGEGTVVMAGVIVNPGACVGRHCILNTACVVEHDNAIGDYAHICPGVALAGTVTIGEGTQIGVGSSVRNNITIAANCLVGAGSAVVCNLDESGVYVGVPARRLR